MKIENITSPTLTAITGAKTEAQVSARERAIAALTRGAQAEPQIVQNQTQVSPEEMSAVVPRTSNNQKDTVESPGTPEPTVETKAPEEPLSAHYAILARKEKAIRQREQQLKAKESAIKAAEEASKTPTSPTFDESKYVNKDRLTQDPFAVLGELGLSYDQLTELAMNAPKQSDIALLNEMKALKAEIASIKGETKKSFEEQQTLQRTQTVNQIRTEVKSLVRNDPQFETINATNSVDDVVSLIEQVYDKDGILLTVEEAAQQVEDYLVDEAIKIAKLSKIQQRLKPATPVAVAKTTDQSEKSTIKTLTNSIASSRQLSARERALLAFKGEKF